MWCAVANTQWGKVPGKCRKGECWFPWGGKAHKTTDFVKVRSTVFSKNEKGTKAQGFQTNNNQALWCAIADTPHGKIPGKAAGGTCWYPYNGAEHLTNSFTYVIGM